MNTLHSLTTALKFSRRELRSGMRGFRIFFFCLMISVMTISAIGNVSEALLSGLATEGRVILGGDLSVSVVQRTFSTEERKRFEALGNTGHVTTMRTSVRTGNGRKSAFIMLKAVDSVYPLVGDFVTASGLPLQQQLAFKDGVPGVVIEPSLAIRLNLEPGDPIRIGEAVFQFRDVIEKEPDRLANNFGFAPQTIISLAALPDTGLVRVGSLLNNRVRILLPEDFTDDLGAIVTALNHEVSSDGVRVRSRDDPAPNLQANIQRFSDFMTLIALATSIVGGVGVANAVRAFVNRQTRSIAIIVSVGGTNRFAFQVYFFQVLILALIASLTGIAAGMATMWLFGSAISDAISMPVDTGIFWVPQFTAFLVGMVMAVVFSLPSLSKTLDLRPGMLFRHQTMPLPGHGTLGAIATSTALLIVFSLVAVFSSSDPTLATIILGLIAVTFFVLLGVSSLSQRMARKFPYSGGTELRMAITNLYRPGALTGPLLVSLGLGLTLLTTLGLIESNLSQQLTSRLPEVTPTYFFIDISRRQIDDFHDLLNEEIPELELVKNGKGTAGRSQLQVEPVLSGRVISLNGVPVDELSVAGDAEWVIRGDRRVTFSDQVPAGSSIVEGEWWSAKYNGEPLVSVEAEAARGLGLKLGDTVTISAFGRPVTARVANFRELAWQSFRINFVFVFSEYALSKTPYSLVSTLTLPPDSTLAEEEDILRRISSVFPTITAIRVKDALDIASGVVSRIAGAIRIAAIVSLITSILVLAGALAASFEQRLYDSVILKVLGATRLNLVKIYIFEFLILGGIASVVALIAGAILSAVLVIGVLKFAFSFSFFTALSVTVVSLLVTLTLGLCGTHKTLSFKPARLLRGL